MKYYSCRRYNQTVGGRPIASVRPMMSTPLNVRTSQSGSNPTRLLIPAGRGVAGLKPGVSLQQIQTTTGKVFYALSLTGRSVRHMLLKEQCNMSTKQSH